MAWHFDETNDNVEVTDSSLLSLPNADWSVGGWINLDDNVGTAFQYFYSHDVNATNPSLNLHVREATAPDGANKLGVRISSGVNFDTATLRK